MLRSIANVRCGFAGAYVSLDASRPWICYWIVHALALLGEEFSNEEVQNVIGLLSQCQAAEGGFGGGPMQIAHLAPTYAAVNALVTMNSEEALKVSNMYHTMS